MKRLIIRFKAQAWRGNLWLDKSHVVGFGEKRKTRLLKSSLETKLAVDQKARIIKNNFYRGWLRYQSTLQRCAGDTTVQGQQGEMQCVGPRGPLHRDQLPVLPVPYPGERAIPAIPVDLQLSIGKAKGPKVDMESIPHTLRCMLPCSIGLTIANPVANPFLPSTQARVHHT